METSLADSADLIEGAVVEAKVISKKKNAPERWIPATIKKVNSDKTVNLGVINAKLFGVNPNAVNVPLSLLRFASRGAGVGSIVQIDGTKRGIVLWCGRHKVLLGSQTWYGVALDSKRGFCDGTWKGIQFFRCKRWHGIVIPESRVSKVFSSPYSEWKIAKSGKKRVLQKEPT